MDKELINMLDYKIHTNCELQLYLANKNGRNKLNAVYSSIDWIRTTIDEIDIDNLRDDKRGPMWIRFINFILCIDIMWEAIKQLHRVFINEKTEPFKEDHSIFKQKTPDNVYFKTIRACFAAHPINLTGVFDDDLENEIWFSFIPGSPEDSTDFCTSLLSNMPDRDGRMLVFYSNELYEFAKKRYEYLEVIIDNIDKVK